MRRRLAPVLLALALALPALDAARAAEQANLEAGRALAARGKLDAAILQLERAIVADPRSAESFMLLGETHRRKGRLGDAMKYLDIALELDPAHLRALRAKGDVLLSRGEVAEAEEILQHLQRSCGDCREYQRLRQKVARAGNG